jgi:transposase
MRISAGGVGETVRRARGAGFTAFEEVAGLDDDELERRLYGPRITARAARPLPDPAWVDTELRRSGVTLMLLHLEYLEQHADGYRYTKFCDHYQSWKRRQGPTMRQVHRAGEKLFVDYAGKKPCIVDRNTGEVVEVELFVAVLGASNYTFVEATLTQKSRDWIASHVRAFEFFGGVTSAVVPDQLKTGVSASCRYEPQTQRTYAEMLCHYGTAALPARPRKPRDKAKVEAGVLVAERWILARLRDQTFYSLSELNARIAELLRDLNARVMRHYRASRRELFERLDKPALKGLPADRFVFGEWKLCKLNIDYHFEYDAHYYSAPFQLQGEKLDVRATATTIEAYLRNTRVAAHPRSYQPGRHTTRPEHMPRAHRAHAEWSPTRLIRWATKIGPHTATLVAAILASRPHPEQGYRSCLGILRLAKRYGEERLEAACARAVAVQARSYKHVEGILKNGLDRLEPLPSHAANTNGGHHENVRGPDYYKQGDNDAE